MTKPTFLIRYGLAGVSLVCTLWLFTAVTHAGALVEKPPVTAVHPAPLSSGLPFSANDDTYTVTEDIPLVEPAPGVWGNDEFGSGQPFTTTLVTAPSHGTLQLHTTDGSFIYTPTANYNGSDTFIYRNYTAGAIGNLNALAYWRFDDGTNPTTDNSGNGHDVTLYNGTTFSSDVPATLGTGASLQFDGVNDTASAAGTINLANQSFTVTAWAKRTSFLGTTNIIVGQGTGTNSTALHIGFRTSNVFTCAFYNNDLNTVATYTDTNWHHWACTYDATTNARKIYQDGVLVASDTATADYQGSGAINIGHRNNGDLFPGLIDDVRIYNYSLSASEVVGTMSLPSGTGESDIATVTLNITAVDDAPIAVNDTYTATEDTPFIAPNIAGNLATLFNGSNMQDGNMFNLTGGPQDIALTALDVNLATTNVTDIAVYYKAGTYVGSETNPSAWTLFGTFSVTGQGTGNATHVDMSSVGTLTIPAGQMVGMYVTVTNTTYNLVYNGFAATYSDGYLTINTGAGLSYPFGPTLFSPRNWNGRLYYEYNNGVLNNDSDVESNLTAVLDAFPSHAAGFDLESNGAFAYTPTTNYCGADIFTYYANDGAQNSNLGTATINVLCVNDPLIANDDVYTTSEDIALVEPAPGIWANDSFDYGEPFTTTVTTPPTHGTLQLNTADGSFTYTPTANYNGSDSFVYRNYNGSIVANINALAYWRFDDGVSPTTDNSGNGHDVTLANGTTFNSDVPTALGTGASLQFDGLNDTADAAGTINLANQSFSVTAWAKRTSFFGTTNIIVGQGTGTNSTALHIGFRNSNVFTCAFYNNDLDTVATYTDTNWHHWACTYDATTNARKIYLDGVLVASDTATADYQGSGAINIGHRNNGDFFPGLIDDVRIYNYALSASEVVDTMSLPAGSGESDVATVTLNITAVNDAPIAGNDTYTTSQGTSFASPLINDSLLTNFTGAIAQGGNMFDITASANNNLTITGFDVNVSNASSVNMAVYYKTGSYVGSEQSLANWTLLGVFPVVGQGQGQATFVDIESAGGGITIPAGQLEGIYVTPIGTASMYYNTGANTYSNSDLTLVAGVGVSYPLGSVFNPRTWNGRVYYEINKGVLLNDSDVESNLTAVLQTNPNHGVVALESDGHFAYTPTITFSGVDTFTYGASDGGITTTATVSITVSKLPCAVETTGDNILDGLSADASAVQTAVDNASPGDLIKVAGTCAGVQTSNNLSQTVHISQSLTLQGGYTITNWLTDPDPTTYPTILDAQGHGTVVYIPSSATDLLITLDSLTLTGGSGTQGGGIHTQAGVLTVTNSLLTNNSATDGGALYNTATVWLDQTTVMSNTTSNNGTIHNEGTFTMTNSTLSDNSAWLGGGVYADENSTSTILNSTLAHNTAQDGGAIHSRGPLNLTFSTLAYNTASVGSAIHNWNNSASLSLVHTVIAYNSGSGLQCFNDGGTLANSLQTLVTDGSCNATISADPLLSDLADNGGNTQTMMPQAFSPVIDFSVSGLYGCGTLYTNDQRGFVRPVDNACDIGAMELETNFVPTALADDYTTAEDTPLSVPAPGVLNNDSDGDGDSLTAVLDTTVLTGSLTFNSDGSFDYTPPADWSGATWFTYHANDGQDDSSVVTVTLTVTAVNDAPIAASESYTTTEDTALTVVAPGVLGNDSDVDGDSLTAVLDSTASNGTLTLNSDGSFGYTPAANFCGADSFSYHANDGQEDSTAVTVTIDVTCVNDAPMVEAGADATAVEGDLVAFSGSYTDPGQHLLADEIHWDFGDGASSTGTLTPTHAYGDNGTFTVTLTITDTAGGVGSDWLVVSVSNAAPTLAPLNDITTTVGTPISFTTSYSDAGWLDTHSESIDWGDGTQIRETAGGTHTYTAAGVFTVTVTLSDDDGDSAVQTFVVTVTAVNTSYAIFLPVAIRN